MSGEDVKIEVAEDRPEIVVDVKRAPEPEVAPTSDEQPVDDESAYAVKVEPADLNRASTPKTYSAATTRRSKLHPWMKNPNAMLGAAIVVGGLAAVLVGNLVLWLLKPAPKPAPRSRYAMIDVSVAHPTDRAGATRSLPEPNAVEA